MQRNRMFLHGADLCGSAECFYVTYCSGEGKPGNAADPPSFLSRDASFTHCSTVEFFHVHLFRTLFSVMNASQCGVQSNRKSQPHFLIVAHNNQRKLGYLHG
eukprot:TRINITY_DN66354_c11_g1_i1.p1 TRINITY_DN66354_c11_g1~~TRINITY_DN66354_c11_g1_i1.p1  ORF type:complete len:102 (+),score=2.21 TRINITY_DN66354_c11_g1_i1:50-355(+)